MSDPFMTDPRLDPRSDMRRTDYLDRAGGTGSAGGLLIAIAAIVIVVAVIYGLSGPSGDNRTGQINTPPAATKTMPPATNPAAPPATR